MTSGRSSQGTAVRRRGRPQQFPFDSTPLGADHVDVDKRLAWLLASSRILNDDPLLTSREHFLRELETRGLVVDSTRISRWESGDQRLRNNVLAAYESILGLPDTLLVALTANLRRAYGLEQEISDHDHNHEALDNLIERAADGVPSGADWVHLATRLTAFDRFYLPAELRVRLCDKLLTEMQLAVGHAQVTRTAAANLLMSNPSSQPQMSRSLGVHTLSRNAQVFHPGMRLLRHVDDRSVSDLALRLMSHERPILAQAAASLVATKLSEGHYGDQSLAIIERHILQGLSAPASSAPALNSFDLASRLPPEAFERIRRHIVDERLRQRLQEVRETSDLQSAGVSRTMVRRIAHAVQEGTPAPFTQEPDQMLIRLVHEALFHARSVRRKHASKLLAASPYRVALSRCCLELASDDNPFVAARAWDLLHLLGPCDGIVLEERALAESRPDARRWALIALGSSAAPLSGHAADAIVELSWEAGADVQHAAMYALGMTGSPALKRLLEHPSSRQRTAAEWWLRVGPAVTS